MNRTLPMAGAAVLCVMVANGVSQMTGSGRLSVPWRVRPLPAGVTAPVVRFEDIAERAGLSGITVSGSDKQQAYIVENTGTGVAILDYDNDGLPDIFVVNGGHFDKTGPALSHFLYHNRGRLSLEDVTAKSGITYTDWGRVFALETAPDRSKLLIVLGHRVLMPTGLSDLGRSSVFL